LKKFTPDHLAVQLRELERPVDFLDIDAAVLERLKLVGWLAPRLRVGKIGGVA
jgi:hypothetical protein